MCMLSQALQHQVIKLLHMSDVQHIVETHVVPVPTLYGFQFNFDSAICVSLKFCIEALCHGFVFALLLLMVVQ